MEKCHLTPRWDIPIIPIVVNAFAPPMPSPKRCSDVGAFIGGCIESLPRESPFKNTPSAAVSFSTPAARRPRLFVRERGGRLDDTIDVFGQ
jgi:hypothetical protein